MEGPKTGMPGRSPLIILRDGMERAKRYPWERRRTEVPPVPVGTPRMRIMEDPSLLGTTKHLQGAGQDHLGSREPPSGGYPATRWVFDPLGQ